MFSCILISNLSRRRIGEEAYRNQIWSSQVAFSRRTSRMRPSKAITKSAAPVALLVMKARTSFHSCAGGTEGATQGSSPCSVMRSADAHRSLWLVLSWPAYENTFPQARQLLGTPKLTIFRLSDRTIFQCLSRSASASALTWPVEVNCVSKLGAGAAVLAVTDLDWLPSTSSVTRRSCFRNSRSCSISCNALINPPAWLASSWQSE